MNWREKFYKKFVHGGVEGYEFKLIGNAASPSFVCDFIESLLEEVIEESYWKGAKEILPAFHLPPKMKKKFDDNLQKLKDKYINK